MKANWREIKCHRCGERIGYTTERGSFVALCVFCETLRPVKKLFSTIADAFRKHEEANRSNVTVK
jgi:hypothetical protein